MSHRKPGDWTCSRCNRLVFGRHDKCTCGMKKPSSGASGATTMRPGDWICSCKFNNFGSRAVCKNCGNARVLTQPATTTPTEVPQGAPQEESKGKTCCVCMERVPNACLPKCRHMSCCIQCIRKVDRCPLCRADFMQKDVVEVFDT